MEYTQQEYETALRKSCISLGELTDRELYILKDKAIETKNSITPHKGMSPYMYRMYDGARERIRQCNKELESRGLSKDICK